VIRSLVERLTQRSSYLRGEPRLQNDSSSSSSLTSRQHPIAEFNRSEIKLGTLLGQGSFSNVYEVIGIQLEHQFDILDKEPRVDNEGSSTYISHFDMLSPIQRQRIRLASQMEGAGHGKFMYAMKCLKPELLEADNPKTFLDAATDLVVEAKYLSKLDHNNILKLRGLAKGWEGAFEDGHYDSFFILVDRLEENLHERIKRWKQGELLNENTLECKLSIALQVASAMAYLADRNLLFRDLKPQNIGLIRSSSRDTLLTVKLFDFGFCRELPTLDQPQDVVTEAEILKTPTMKAREATFLMSGKGTRRYMAPEVLRFNCYNLKCDVYSFAMNLYELLTLQKPFYQYSREQHSLFVVEGGDRPPLDASSYVTTLWSGASSYGLSLSLSSIGSTASFKGGDESIDFEQCMTNPLRDLLRQAWHQDLSQRPSMEQVNQQLQAIKASLDDDDDIRDIPETTEGCLSSILGVQQSCLGGEIRDALVELASDIRDLPFSACFGRDIYPHSSIFHP